MGITANNNNAADILGYEMKKDSKSRTTFGDWSPNRGIWKNIRPDYELEKITRKEFFTYFGKPNHLKKNRMSWSGEPVPKIGGYNTFGQILKVDLQKNIIAEYSYIKDTRPNKSKIIPDKFKVNDLILVKWEKDSMKKKIERKFNQKGWFKCVKNSAGVYDKIGFGAPFDYDAWIKLVKEGVVYFDSGMYDGNPRPYAQWRANTNYWDSLIIEEYF